MDRNHNYIIEKSPVEEKPEIHPPILRKIKQFFKIIIEFNNNSSFMENKLLKKKRKKEEKKIPIAKPAGKLLSNSP